MSAAQKSPSSLMLRSFWNLDRTKFYNLVSTAHSKLTPELTKKQIRISLSSFSHSSSKNRFASDLPRPLALLAFLPKPGTCLLNSLRSKGARAFAKRLVGLDLRYPSSLSSSLLFSSESASSSSSASLLTETRSQP